MIQDKSETVDSVEEEGNIMYMKWLGNSNTLLYMVEKHKVQGMPLLQISAVRIASINYDEKNDILYISNPKGKLWGGRMGQCIGHH